MYRRGRYAASKDRVWKDANGKIVSMTEIFPEANGTLGSYTTYPKIDRPTDDQQLAGIDSKLIMYDYTSEMNEQSKIKDHIQSRPVNISQLLLSTISLGMLNILRKDPAGCAIMDELSKSLEMIDYIIGTDYSPNTQLTVDKYFKAKIHFEFIQYSN